MNWALARREGWTLRMRLEDLDSPRVKPEAEAGALGDLAWLGIDWDGPMLRQSDDLEPYRAAMRRLAALGLVYRCERTRSEIAAAAASAPHGAEHEQRFPESLRPAPDDAAWGFEDEDAPHRLRLDPGARTVDDAFAGRRVHDPAAEVGDLLVWTRRGTPSYQLAVVVDDARQRVTDVVRADDLLPSAARQATIGRHLRLPEPRWWHLPLVVGPDGRRLAKRHGDTRVAAFREAGVPAARVIGLLRHWCDGRPPAPCDASDFAAALDLDALPRTPTTCTEADVALLLDGRSLG